MTGSGRNVLWYVETSALGDAATTRIWALSGRGEDGVTLQSASRLGVGVGAGPANVHVLVVVARLMQRCRRHFVDRVRRLLLLRDWSQVVIERRHSRRQRVHFYDTCIQFPRCHQLNITSFVGTY